MSSTETVPIISHACPDGTLIECLYDAKAGTTALAVATPDGTLSVVPQFDVPDGGRFIPYSANNNLLTAKCVLLPSDIGDVGDVGEVVSDIRRYIDRYVALSADFAELAPYYVLLTWVYDAFEEMPLLRFRGDFGSGKTRALQAIGSICYKPFFASGASTVSPIFHILDAFRGTLVLDEADFRFSDMTGELVKILNNGTVNGLPVLRTMSNRHRELNPKAFRVFGPKIIAMREHFNDAALESRLITEEMGRRTLPPHIPIHTPSELAEGANRLRNRLLAWRFRYRHTVHPNASRAIPGVSARTNQMALPLLALVDDETVRARLASFLCSGEQQAQQARRETVEARVLAAIIGVIEAGSSSLIRIADVTVRLNADVSSHLYGPLTNKAVGAIVRDKLGISTIKSNGTYGITQDMRARVYALADRLGLPHSLWADHSTIPNDLE